MSTDLALVDDRGQGAEIVREARALSWREVQGMANTLAKARGFVPRALEGQPHAIAAAILTGQELGLGPMESLRSIHVVEGKPTLSAELMLSLAIRAGVKHKWTENTNLAASIRLSRAGQEADTFSFTMEDAKRAGLTGKQNWRKYPSAMLRARCLSAALRAYCPDVLGGSVYVEGELEPDEPEREAAPVDEVLRLIESGELERGRELANHHRRDMSSEDKQRIRAAIAAAKSGEADEEPPPMDYAEGEYTEEEE